MKDMQAKYGWWAAVALAIALLLAWLTYRGVKKLCSKDGVFRRTMPTYDDLRKKNLESLLAKRNINLNHLSYSVNSHCHVLNKISPGEYSNIATQTSDHQGTKKIFSVCGYEPVDFARNAADSRKAPDGSPVAPASITAAQLQKTFPHFSKFEEAADNRGVQVIRILLINGNLQDWISRNRDYLKVFSEASGQHVRTFVADCLLLRTRHGLHYLTDHVIYDDEFCIDYYQDSETALLTPCDGNGVCKEIASFPQHFQTHKDDPAVYLPLADFIKQHIP